MLLVCTRVTTCTNICGIRTWHSDGGAELIQDVAFRRRRGADPRHSDGGAELIQDVLGVAQQHPVVVIVEDRVVEPCHHQQPPHLDHVSREHDTMTNDICQGQHSPDTSTRWISDSASARSRSRLRKLNDQLMVCVCVCVCVCVPYHQIWRRDHESAYHTVELNNTHTHLHTHSLPHTRTSIPLSHAQQHTHSLTHSLPHTRTSIPHSHAPLEKDRLLSFPNTQDRHAGNGAHRIILRC